MLYSMYIIYLILQGIQIMERAHASAMKAYAMSMVLYNEDLRKVVINALAIEIDAVCYISRFVPVANNLSLVMTIENTDQERF